MLGTKAPIAAFRWDLVYLLAQLGADERPGVSALAGPIQALRARLDDERAAFEQAEDVAIVASALLRKNDKRRDGMLVEAGGVARAIDKEVYAALFPRLTPTATGRLGIAAESAEVKRILGEMARLAPEHPVREAYEQDLAAVEAAVVAAGGQSNEAVTALALQRSQLQRFKLELDQGRLETHGRLLALLKDKSEADALFRPTTAAPDEESKADNESAAPEARNGPAAGGAS